MYPSFQRTAAYWSRLFLVLGLPLLGLPQGHSAEPVRYLNSTTFADSVVTFNEVMYHPQNDESAGEWIELHNQLAVMVDLSNWTLEGGVEFRFPVGTRILGGGYLVIAANPTAFQAQTGLLALGPFSDQLSNAGERLVLKNHNQRLMDQLEFGDSAPWPAAADGSGASLAKRIAASPSSPPENWQASKSVGGTPRAVNFSEVPGSPETAPSLLFSEVPPANAPGFWCELINASPTPLALQDYRIRSSRGTEFRFAPGPLNPGTFRILTTNELGFVVEPGDRLFVLQADGLQVLDAVILSTRPQARRLPVAGEPFLRPALATPGAANHFALQDEIVINEILYHAPPTYARPAVGELPAQPFVEDDEQWIELHNRSTHAVDVGGWKLIQDVRFEFPPHTVIAAGDYLVVAGDAARLQLKYPDVRILGNWQGELKGRIGHLVLRDSDNNPVDEVRYFDDAPWPSHADGGGSSLELRNPWADNRLPEAWAASDESSRSVWKKYTYRAKAINPTKGPTINGFHEFRMGLLSDGTVLVDDVSVIEDPDGTARPLIQNSTFNTTQAWRLLGNHSHSRIVADPDQPGNQVLQLTATDARGYMHNQLETTLKSGTTIVPVVVGRTYEFSFRAKWLGGSPQLHTELYYNKVARTTILDQPLQHGTPGRRNSTWVTNLGPNYTTLYHSPLIPKTGQAVTVSVRATDPDEIAELKLYWSVNGGVWQERLMMEQGGDVYTANLPSQAVNAIVQFYVEGRDALGAISTYPAGGKNSRALYRVDNRVAKAPRKGLFFILTQADGRLMDSATNMMSDDRLGTTVIWDNREVFYDCGVHLHGSMFSRSSPDTTPYSLKFPADHKFRGVHRTIQPNRGVIEEIIGKHTQNQTGLPGMYEDIVDLYSHRSANSGAARLSLAHYNDIFLGSQFENGTRGTLFNMEGIRVLQATHNNSPEGIKLGMPVGWVGDYDVMNLGNDPEQYRWSTTLRNNRSRDDYSRYIAMAKVFSLTGTALELGAPAVMDVDQWMRYYALLTLFEIGDTYTFGNPHNIGFFARPSDGKIIALPYDWDFFFANGDTSALWGNQNLAKFVTRPVFTRLFYGHLLDMIDGAFSTNYLTPYIANFGTVAGQNFNGYLSRIRGRSQYVRGRLPAKIPFEISSNAGANFTVDTPQVTLDGRGWVDVVDIRLVGQGSLPVTWLDGARWRATLPLAARTNLLQLEAFNRRGEKVGADSIAVITSDVEDSQRRFLRISEIYYHPVPPTAGERAAGFTDADDFEFIEVANFGPAPLSLEGVRFVAGIQFDFTRATITNLPPGGRLVVVRNRVAFATRYPEVTQVAGEYSDALGNGGDLIRLEDRLGLAIHEVAYLDEAPWPSEADGLGYSLELLTESGSMGTATGWRLGALGGSPGGALEPATPPGFSNVQALAGRLVLQFNAQSGQSYRIQTRSALSGGPWQDRWSIPAQEGNREVRVDDELNDAARFYRLSTP